MYVCDLCMLTDTVCQGLDGAPYERFEGLVRQFQKLVSVYMLVCVCACMHVCMRSCMSMCVCACVFACICVFVQAFMH